MRAQEIALEQQRAKAYFEEGQLEEAERTVERILGARHDHFPTRQLALQIADRRQNTTLALELASELVQRWPERPWPYKKLAELLRVRGDRQGLEALVARASERLEPQTLASVQLQLAKLLYSSRAFADAERHTRHVVQIQRDHLAAARLLINCLRKQGRIREAKQWLDEYCQRQPQDAWFTTQRASFDLLLGNTREAEAALKKALELDPSDALALREYDLLLHQAGREVERLALLERHHAEHGTLHSGLQLARAYLQHRKHAECSKLQSELEQRYPSDPQITALSVRAAIERDDWERAQRSCALLERLTGEDAGTVLLQGQILSQSHSYTATLELFARHHSMLKQSRAGLVQYLDLAGYRAEIDLLNDLTEQAGRHFGTSFSVVVRLVELDTKRGYFERALQRLGSFQAQTVAERASVEEAEGNVWMRRFQLERAIAHYTRAAELQPRVPRCRRSLGLALMLNAKFEAAHAEFSAASSAERCTTSRPVQTSQHFHARILNELRTRPDMLDALSLALTSHDPMGKLLALARREPDYSGTALLLFAQLTQAGVTERLNQTASVAPARIPKILMQFWDGPEIPPDVLVIMDRTRACHPDWHYQRFNEKQALTLIAEYLGSDVAKAFVLAPHPAMKADVFRLASLYLQGGVYVDADDCCIRPLDALIDQGKELLVYQEYVGSIGNNFLAVTPKHAVIREALHQTVKNILHCRFDYIWFATGPGVITRVLGSALARQLLAGRETFPNWSILSIAELQHFVWMRTRSQYKHTTKSWTLRKL